MCQIATDAKCRKVKGTLPHMRKINEIFYSIQGEGHHTGYPSVFIRFSGCNLACPFCDTRHEKGIYMSDEDIFRTVNNYPALWIILTGGEPLMQVDSEFIRKLKKETGKKVAIETNGTMPVPDGIDWIAVSPKEVICGEDGLGKVVIDKADEIKVVDVGQELERYFDLSCRSEKTLMYLQPCFVKEIKDREANRLRTLRRILVDPRWNLSVQLHRYLNIP